MAKKSAAKKKAKMRDLKPKKEGSIESSSHPR